MARAGCCWARGPRPSTASPLLTASARQPGREREAQGGAEPGGALPPPLRFAGAGESPPLPHGAAGTVLGSPRGAAALTSGALAAGGCLRLDPPPPALGPSPHCGGGAVLCLPHCCPPLPQSYWEGRGSAPPGPLGCKASIGGGAPYISPSPMSSTIMGELFPPPVL